MSVKDLSPIGDRVLVAVKPAPETTASGLVLASSQQSTSQAVVLAAGPKCEQVKEGDVVLISSNSRHTGVDIDVRGDDSEYRMLMEEQILGVYQSDPG